MLLRHLGPNEDVVMPDQRDTAAQPEVGSAPAERGRLPTLALAALGVVYGDIGTSPLYAVRECFFGSTPLAVTPANMLGVLSLIFWALVLVISVKYLLVIMRADNNGEGGILALLARLDPWHARSGWLTRVLILFGLFGAALLLGDGMITPAISVLSAVEGIEVAAPGLDRWVIPLTVVILVGLFLFQKRGTASIGALFGPIMIFWFFVLGGLGVVSIASHPAVLAALNPAEAVALFVRDPGGAFLVLGGVFLVVTGGEALYADMGHFGPAPIRLAWFGLVLPALLLNYFGQGAYILTHPGEALHPFYNLVPHWGVYPMVLLSTIVTVIASQAVISGTFSLARQAIQLNQSPKLQIIQTSPEEIGQIYVPVMNWVLFVGTLALVVGFKSSSNLAAAYGVAVSATMVITTVLAFFVMRRQWQWSLPLAGGIVVLFLSADIAFFSANLSKVWDGGWFPILVALFAMLVMTTWSQGRELYRVKTAQRYLPIDVFLNSLELSPPARIPGAAVFLTPPDDTVPGGLLHHLKLNQVLHERILLVTVVTLDVPRVPASQRFQIDALPCGFCRVWIRYGFMQSPNLPLALKFCADQGHIANLDADNLVYYADRATLVVSPDTRPLRPWRKRLYAFMARNSERAVEYYKLPPGRSVELGIQVEL